MRKIVVIVFSDSSLGGTSRSAITMAKAWRRLDRDIVFVPFGAVNDKRLVLLKTLGEVNTLYELDWSLVELVHWHHGANDIQNKHILESLSANAPAGTPLLTHNIFGSPDYALRQWAGPQVTAVLGDWAAYEYRFASGRRTPVPLVIGNPQDDYFFRPPQEKERLLARESLQVDEGSHVVLRAGSPLISKWSTSYLRLARSLEQNNIVLVLVGVPASLVPLLSPLSHVRLLPLTDNDARLRSLYWAADVFALDAEQGESFGNVAIESLLTGCPVVYRAREYRDNTPWEFRSLSGFYYEKNERDWIARIGTLVDAPREGVDYMMAAQKYGVGAVAAKLDAAATQLLGRGTRPESRLPATLGFGQRLRVRLRHNPWANELKIIRRRNGWYGTRSRG